MLLIFYCYHGDTDLDNVKFKLHTQIVQLFWGSTCRMPIQYTVVTKATPIDYVDDM